MPILTPSAEAGAANSAAPAAMRTMRCDFIFASRLFQIASMIFDNPAATQSFRTCRGRARRGLWRRRPGFRFRPIREIAHHNIEDRREDKPEQGYAQHAEEHGDANRLPHLRSGTR